MSWQMVKPYEGKVYQGCLSCSPVEKVAPMDMVIGVGFGVAQVTCDEELIYSEPTDPDGWEDFWTTADAERAALADPDHDWRILLVGPLRECEYQRHGLAQWALIDSGPGLA